VTTQKQIDHARSSPSAAVRSTTDELERRRKKTTDRSSVARTRDHAAPGKQARAHRARPGAAAGCARHVERTQRRGGDRRDEQVEKHQVKNGWATGGRRGKLSGLAERAGLTRLVQPCDGAACRCVGHLHDGDSLARARRREDCASQLLLWANGRCPKAFFFAPLRRPSRAHASLASQPFSYLHLRSKQVSSARIASL